MSRRPLRPAFGAPFLLLLSGCAPTSQDERAQFIEPPAMARTLAQADARGSHAEAAWPSDQWWRRYGSVELDQVMEKALADNQNVKRAVDRLSEAEAISKVEGARLLPFLDADIGMRQSRIPNHGVVASYNPDLAGQEKTMAFINPLSLRYEFDFWGKNRAAMEAALGEAAAREAELAETRLLLATAVARAYFRGLAASGQLDLAREMTGLRREGARLAESRFRAGLDTQDAVATANADVEAALKREAGVAAVLALQKDLLARLMGEGPDAAHDLFAGKRKTAAARPALPKRLPVELLAHRPDLAAALRRAEAAAERIHIAKADFLPSIDLSVAAGLEASVQSTHIGQLANFLFRPSAFNYAVAPGFHLPLFQGGRLSGKLEGRRSEYDIAVDSYNETLLQAAQQVADSLANVRQSRAALDAQTRLHAATRSKLALARVRLRDGLKDRREIVTAGHDVLEQLYVQRALEADHLSATVDLNQALGGGYAEGPNPTQPKPAPETDDLTPVVDAIQSIGGG